MSWTLINVTWIILIVSQLTFVYAKPKPVSSNGNLFLGKYDMPDKTPDPININTTDVYEVKLPPLHLVAILFTLTKLINTGISVQALLDQPLTLGQATGGVLGKDVYEFQKFDYYWTNSSNESAGILIDGQGFPFETRVYFRNRKYRTTEEAWKKRDGFVAVVLPFNICSTTNLLFDLFAAQLKHIQKPGSHRIVFLGVLVLSVDFISLNGIYYSYPGSYIDSQTGVRYSCATVIVVKPSPTMCITSKQFDETFSLMKNSQGKHMTNVLQQYPADMPIVKGKYVTQSILLEF